jgi:hypothetical protein
MKTRAILALTAAAGLAGVANAQTQTQNSTVSFTLSFQDTGNHDGIVQPGESALITMNVSFTGQNTVGSFAPPVGTFSSGTIRGLGAGFVDLTGTANNGGNANGNWDVTDAIDPTWDLIGSAAWGTPASAGSNLQNVQFGQFPTGPNAINTTNPINAVWHGTWTPASFTSRTVTFTVGDGAASGGFGASVLFRTGSSSLASAFALESYGNVTIPVAPAPASLALLGLGGLVAGRRRR